MEISGQPALDALLGHDAADRERFARLNELAEQVLRRLQARREDAFAGLVGSDEDATERARSLLRRIERDGMPRTLAVVGSIVNEAGSRFAGLVPWTTFVRAELEDQTQIWSLLWREDGTYRGTAIGPRSDLPAFVLGPTGVDRYTGVEHESPWRLAAFRFENDCLTSGDLRACR